MSDAMVCNHHSGAGMVIIGLAGGVKRRDPKFGVQSPRQQLSYRKIREKRNGNGILKDLFVDE